MRLLILVFTCWSGWAWAQDFEGLSKVYLEENDGTRLHIADIGFGPETYAVTLNKAVFENHFLSMRPFECIEGPDKHWCYLPYPYEIARAVSADDLTDLEYDFLFIWKGATDYGIDDWNGVYYVIRADGDRLTGQLHEVDMGLLAVPPEAGELRPLKPQHLEPSDPESHWLPRLVIE